MNIQQAIGRAIRHLDLSRAEMIDVMRQIMTGQCSDAQIGAFMVALRMKSESIEEITGAAEVMRELATKVELQLDHLVDTCGTGGDGMDLFNVSTAAAFVVAAAGARVAKHGNRSVSSATGSADVLEAAGVRLDLNPQQVAQCVADIGVGFMFAPGHHAAMKHAIGPRKELAQRTIFNMLGPMTNPAGVRRQVIGVFNADLCRPMAEVLKNLGSEHVMVVHAQDGLDEISIAAETHVAELKDGDVSEYRIKPSALGFAEHTLEGLTVNSAEQSLALIEDALGKQAGPYAEKAADMIAINAGAAIYVSGVADSLQQGVDMARDAIDAGLAKAKLSELVTFSNTLKNVED